MKITCISDLHGHLPQLGSGDLLIVAGDLTARDRLHEYGTFFEWLARQQYTKKIIIAGNHDGYFTGNDPKEAAKQLCGMGADSFEYLCDSACEFEGLKVWGSPWTPTFYDWHFMKDRGAAIKEKWDLIPSDTDILITHGPPFGILDKVKFSSKANKGNFAGCEELRKAIERIQPRLHIFGHVHEGYGTTVLKCTPHDVLCVNASIMNENYDPVNKPISFNYQDFTR